ncbi:MAG: PQQ-dependent sugar dehydrogenase [Paracoccus sp. (in: a-proteobacteria)]|uniref:PQQ-dependent sugar dehydrogenase n=2 Tax=Paracoccus TaxID=265 RepID=UPI000C483DE3|nr:sorbosone dehydrogenase [Paracoccus sp. (in: a-proteobacteria)]MBA48203.1 sorbosone dehydrogenase [Paracoccus sp. (in: a-proteobacteria)]HIC66022.1 sorbosone dehydrogenase [Paracoccus sp. (in: a-proteobacteria)]|tara:strand:- start:271 stop:1524 length:1254 start_codon:yes stop_codon:yes gene_type:complete
MNTLMLGAAAAALMATAAVAQNTDVPDNLDKLSNFKSTGTTEFTYIDQTGDYADGIKKTLEKIKLPQGFKIALYAVVPDARNMAVGPQGIVTFVGTRKDKVWSITDRNKDRVADEVKDFAPSLAFTIPNGPCFSKDGFLYIAEQNRVLLFPAAEFFYESPDVAAFSVLKQGDLIPPDEESFNHTARVCDIGPDGKLYIALGQPFNVPPPEKMEKYDKYGLGGIIRINTDGTGREVFARGIRNSVGMDFDPDTGDLWFTDNQVDGMGDDIPPGEINHVTEAGQNFGFPWYGGGDVRTVEYKDQDPPADVVMPAVEMTAHAADLGMTFYTGSMFPEKYRGAIFSAQHGSWNRTTPVGARVMVTYVAEDGSATTEPFAEGWIDENDEYLGRPVDVAQLRDGSLLVSDDLAGAVYRISYGE